MLLGIHVRSAGVISLEEQAIRRDDPMKTLKWRKTDRRFRVGGEPRDIAPDHTRLPVRGFPIGPIHDSRAKRLRPRIVRRGRGFVPRVSKAATDYKAAAGGRSKL